MSYMTHRPSILHRPVKTVPSKVHEETYETQYEREQAKLAQKAEKQQETQERLMRSLYSTPQDRMTVYQDIETLEEQRKAVQEADRQRMAAREEAYQRSGSNATDALRASMQAGNTMPWNTQLHTSALRQHDEEAARRRFATEVAAENARMIAERRLAQQQAVHMERQQAQQALHSQGSQYHPSVGSQKWLEQHGPQQAPYGQGASHGQHHQQQQQQQAPRPASAQAPWGTEHNAAVRAVQGQALPPKQYPWSWQ